MSKAHGASQPAVAPDALIEWGKETYEQTIDDLRIPESALFAESASLNGLHFGGNGGFAYVWPLSTQFRVQKSLARIDPATYEPILRAFSDETHARYWNDNGGGYRSGVGAGATLFYDDNAHMAVALMEASGDAEGFSAIPCPSGISMIRPRRPGLTFMQDSV